ncbi:P-loop containing nucleoside triphosphate hydrolase protein [Butyriboletus roseoflavus]|nr:P-loop containing nucleoside triphosphate hydrolase protein [Butyriboletus roseoflavus]
MGFFSVLARCVPTVLSVASSVLGLIPRPNKENPSVAGVQARQDAEREKDKAIRDLQSVNDRIEEMKRKYKEEREEADARQEKLKRDAARTADDMERMKAQMKAQTDEAILAANRAEARAKEAANDAKEEVAKLTREAREAREHTQKIQEDAQKATAAAMEMAEKAQRAADEQRRQSEAAKARAEEAARKAAEEAKKANEAKEEAERRLKEGIQPVVTPTPAELAAAKRRIQYRADCFHFAVAGISGSGKSSLVNAFRGLRSRQAGAAAVGITETTIHMTRYPDDNPDNPFVWYDIPGAGTLRCRDWQYFNDQGLYVFDCIIVLFDNRFTMTDVAILVNARRFNIPTYIVRSKADQHISNVMMDMGYEGDDEEDVERRDILYKAARKQFIDNTRKSVKDNLEDANLPNQRVYIVSNSTLLSIVLNRTPKKTIDEVDLLNDLFNEAYRRRRTGQGV